MYINQIFKVIRDELFFWRGGGGGGGGGGGMKNVSELQFFLSCVCARIFFLPLARTVSPLSCRQ